MLLMVTVGTTVPIVTVISAAPFSSGAGIAAAVMVTDPIVVPAVTRPD